MSQNQLIDGEIIDFKEDTDLTIEEIEKLTYQGYPPWRKDKYSEMRQILQKLILAEELEQFQK